MQTVGDYLKKEREAKNISLREASRLTKISEFYLDFLEKDDYEKLPQGPYIKGYISSYARLIGGNADEALRLYDSLQKQKDQTEAIQPEISKDRGWQASIASSLKSVVSSFHAKKNNGGEIRPEEPKFKVKKAPAASFLAKIGCHVNAVASSIKAKTFSLKAAIPSPKTIVVPFKAIPASLRIAGFRLKAAMPSSRTIVCSLRAAGASVKTIAPPIQKSISSLKTIAPSLKKAAAALNANRWLFNKRTWLYACCVLLSGAILVLAGFGFYHLFVYEKSPRLVADLETLHDKGSKTSLAMNAERNVSPSRSNDASIPSNRLHKAPAGVETLSPLSSDRVGEVSTEKPSAKDLSKPSRSAAKMSALPSKKTLPADKPASKTIAAGKEITAQSRQGPISTSLSPASTSAFVNLNVLKATVCADIKDRMPAGVGNSFPWSTQRVYVWSLVEAEHLPSKIRHIYYLEGQKVSDVALNVGSSSWRTWSYKTISNERYRGQWRVDIASAEGHVLQSLYFEVN